MANTQWTANSAFLEWSPRRFSGLEIVRRDTLSMASFAAFEGKHDELSVAIHRVYAVDLPKAPKRATGKDIEFLWYGPSQWLALAERGNGRDLELELAPILKDLASIVDQSDARAVVEISGPNARDVLRKGVPVDLDPAAFKPNDVAITHASHIGVLLCRTDDTPTYQISMFRSFADSFAEWLFDASEEYLVS